MTAPVLPDADTLDAPLDAVAGSRYCPTCHTVTDDDVCPADNTPTQVRDVLVPAGPVVRVADVIAGRYRITEAAGSGGFGAVYAAENLATGQRVAVKMLRAEDDPIAARRFRREAEVTARLQHPNTVRVFDVGEEPGGALWLAMEWLAGQTLDAYLAGLLDSGAVMAADEALTIAVPILGSLREAHAHGLVHRDLKPSNVMLVDVQGQRHVKVVDFGIAQVADSSLTGSDTALGTPAYMSPEQCLGAAIDGRADLYALGCVLFRCVTGQPPHHARNPMHAMYRQIHGATPDVRSFGPTPVNDRFAAIVTCALQKDARHRYPDADAMLADVAAVLDGLDASEWAAAALARLDNDRVTTWSEPLDDEATEPGLAVGGARTTSPPMPGGSKGIVAPGTENPPPPKRSARAAAIGAVLVLVGGVGAVLWSSQAPSADDSHPAPAPILGPDVAASAAAATPLAAMGGGTHDAVAKAARAVTPTDDEPGPDSDAADKVDAGRMTNRPASDLPPKAEMPHSRRHDRAKVQRKRPSRRGNKAARMRRKARSLLPD